MPLSQPSNSAPEPEVYRTFENRSAALTYMCELLGSVAGQALVVVSSKQAQQEVLRLQVGSGQRIQSVQKVPSQQDRPSISVASYGAVLQAAQTPYGVRQIDRDTQELVVFDNPHQLAPRLIRLLRCAFPLSQPFRALTTNASPTAERYMREVFSGPPKLAPASHSAERREYIPSSWAGTRIGQHWPEQTNCYGDGFDSRFALRETAVWNSIRQENCPNCPVADSCLAAGLSVDQHNAGKRQRFWGAWGGLSEGARRELRTALQQGASPTESAYLVERARTSHPTETEPVVRTS